ncbi:MAG: ATP-binding protein [Bacteroidales bacterium]|nr:ATP-binding protein [Bacteroidales bacterium]MBR0304587.1 ATP-binding protein [Bacteroidales bacterium]
MKKNIVNPFICQGYKSPEYFCDRIEETEIMNSTLYNGRNITLISPRRLGKTGLIWNTFHHIKSENKDAICIYIDIFPTKSQSEFVRILGTAVLNETLSKSKMLGKKMLEMLGSLRPVLGMDALTGMPNVTLNVDPTQSEMTIQSIFTYLNKIQKEVFIAIDEFQQINEYPESGTEAMLRSYIQFSHSIHFIFSGSRKHLMSEMFASPKRPFYQSTDMMNLAPLDEEIYYQFANRFFEARKGVLDREVFHELYDIYDGYTWYIQSVLNRLYEKFKSVSSSAQLRETILNVVESKSPQYESIVPFLTENQFSLLRAVAKEGLVEQPMGKEFIKKHGLPGASSVKTALDVLCEKELLYRMPEGYIVYDRFMNQWLQRI